MRLVSALLAFTVLALTQPVQDPARLEVTAAGGSLSYKVVNLSPYTIVGFEVSTQFTSGGFESLGCFVNAQVKSAEQAMNTVAVGLPTFLTLERLNNK